MVATMTDSTQELTVTARKSGRWWSLQCEEYPAAISQVARLDQAVEYMTEAIAFVAEREPSTFTLRVVPELPAEITRELAESVRLRAEARSAETRAGDLVRAAARQLQADGLSLRDIGVVLDVSYQRAHQLLAPAS